MIDKQTNVGRRFTVSQEGQTVEVDLLQLDDESLLVARWPDGTYTGVVCDPLLVPTLRTFVSPANSRLARFWQDYEGTRGASAFFWDVLNIAQAISQLNDVPNVRQLLRFTTATDLFHNAWQARLMLRAASAGYLPEIIPVHPTEPRPDFRVRAGLDVEVKTIVSTSSVELSKQGMRLPPPDVDKLQQAILRKVREAETQTGVDGVAIVALWDDIVANLICRHLPTVPVGALIFQSATVVLALGPTDGDHPHVVAVCARAELPPVPIMRETTSPWRLV